MAPLQCRYGIFEVIPGDSIVSASLRLYGEWAERELCLMRRFITPGSTVADVGAFFGAHAVALARAVGSAGRVLAFEPRNEFFAFLARNVALNHLDKNVTLYQMGLGDARKTLAVAPVDLAGACDPGNLSLQDVPGGSAAVTIDTLDSLDLTCLDFVTIDIRGAQSGVFHGARGTIARLRPVIHVRVSSASRAADAVAALSGQDYVAFAHADYAFNPENYRNVARNMFGDSKDAALVFIPTEKRTEYDLRDLRPLHGPDDAAAWISGEPRLRVAVDTGSSASEDDARVPMHAVEQPASMIASLREALVEADAETGPTVEASDCTPDGGMHIVVPFYKNEALVEQIFKSLNDIAEEILEIGGKVFFYNDSPDYDPLQTALDSCRFDNEAIEFHVVRNPANLGFVGTCNIAFARAKEERADIVLLNSDTIVFPGALREIRQVAQLDPMIGFVCPRSNNATLATLPHSFLDQDVTPQEGYAAFLRLSAYLPRFSYTPTAVGFCLFAKWRVFSELGSFDPIYAAGYNEENDLVLRANRCGYRAVMANRAFVWHQGEQSFAASKHSRTAREEKNAPILHSRYPEYLPLIRAYFSSPEYRAEELLEYVDGRAGELTVAFDCSNFGAYFNGTFESGIKLIEAASRVRPKHWRIAVYMEKAAWRFHGLERLQGVERLDVDDAAAKVAAIVRVGQPFDPQAVSRLVTRAPVVGIFMLDTISYDCGYLSLTFDHKIWRYVFEHIDIVFTNSRYTLDRISNRFKLGRGVLRRVSRHSLDVAEYGAARDVESSAGRHIFVIGNHFSHKFVRQTVDALAAEFPDRKIVAVGYGPARCPHANVNAHESGGLSNEAFERFYTDADAVIFPSHYEGFGFPILHALARNRPVYVRDSALYRELAPNIKGAENIHYFCTTADLIADIRANGTRWVASGKSGEVAGWDRSAREVFHALEQARGTVSYDALVERLRQLDYAVLATGAGPAIPSASRLVGMKVEALVDRILKVPGVKPIARRGWRMYRRLRARQ